MRYVTFDTRSDERSQACPSTDGQLVLLRLLAGELREIGAADVVVDQHGYVTATIPSTTAKQAVPTIGFIAHVDTSPEMSGADVKPILHAKYDGRDLVLPDDPTVVLRLAGDHALGRQMGHDIITASGLTLLGADDKAGVAEIMGAAEFLMRHAEIPHGPIRIGFTPDEEIGRGADRFDVQQFGAFCAYTLDGGEKGELEIESFSADSMTIGFQGFNTHPGYAKGRMINAIKMAADFIDHLPRGALSPETTEASEGYVHPYILDASVDRTSVRLLVRDFEASGLKEKEQLLVRIADEVLTRYPGGRYETSVVESYRNMKEVLSRFPAVVEAGGEAIARAGLEVAMQPIRGGTDGSRLSFMGLPTPNLFAGQHNVHSRLEWISGQDMDKAVEVIVHLCCVWEERT
jgi:tripeptide aminopeptidase